MAVKLAYPSQTQLTRSFDRIFEEAHVSGELKISCRKLKDFPKQCAKYNLGDTVRADLSKNKFSELPSEVCEFFLLERLDCYHNVIRSIPESVITLQSLTYLNLSRNQLSTIPLALCQLPLEVLILSNNKLVSLPEEIGHLQNLMELDASCNEIAILPPHIGDLLSLRSLNIRRNQLVELRPEVCELRLVKLDISGNRISVLPPTLRLMNTLQDLLLDHNPLTSPPAFLCTRGKVHIFKYLDIQAIKEDKKRGAIIDSEFRWSGRKPGITNDLRLQNGFGNDSRWKRSTVDSGYNTSDGGEKRWSQDLQELNSDLEEAPKFHVALRAAEATKEQRQERDLKHRRMINSSDSSVSTLSRNSISSLTSRQELNRKGLDEEEEDNLSICSKEETRSTSLGRHNNEPNCFSRSPDLNSNRSSSCGPSERQNLASYQQHQAELKKKNLHPESYKEFKESRRQLRTGENGTVYGRRPSNGSTNGSTPGSGQSSPSRQETPSPQSNRVSPEEDYTNKMELHKNNQTRMEVAQATKRIQESFAIAHRKSIREQVQQINGKSPTRSTNGDCLSPTHHLNQMNPFHGNAQPVNHPGAWKVPNIAHNGTTHNGKATQNGSSPPMTVDPKKSNFTIRRELDKSKEEKELVDMLRNIIEVRLKVSLPEDLSSSLMDGVVLCHLANNIRPRSVATIHVPSPAVPKLTIAKCRRNVENFLEACRRIGVVEELLCNSQDVLEERGLVQLAITVQELIKRFQSTRGSVMA